MGDGAGVGMMREHATSVIAERELEGAFHFAGLQTPPFDSEAQGGNDFATEGQFSEFVARLLDVHEYERQRIGQELHDSTGQMLVSLQLGVARLRSIYRDGGHDELLDEIQDTVRKIDKEIRALAFLHYPAELGGRNLCEAVASLVRGFGSRTGIRTAFKCLGDLTGITETVSLTLLRVAQEALVNVHRHSRASAAKVTLERQVGSLRLTVSDNGVGLPAPAKQAVGGGIGLEGMRYRVETQGGQFNVRSLKHGTKISAAMPMVA
jgi:signal transduction histidine kinase